MDTLQHNEDTFIVKFHWHIIIIIIIIYYVYTFMYTNAWYRSFRSRKIKSIYLVVYVLCRKVMCAESTFIMIITGNKYTKQENAEIFHVKGFNLYSDDCVLIG